MKIWSNDKGTSRWAASKMVTVHRCGNYCGMWIRTNGDKGVGLYHLPVRLLEDLEKAP